MSRFMTHYSKHGKVMPSDSPYYIDSLYNKHSKFIHSDFPYDQYGESYPARVFEYTHFPYTYAYDVPGIARHQRSLYGRGLGSVSEYGYRSPYAYRSELFGGKYLPYLTAEELDYYRDHYHPRYSRYRQWYY